MTHQKFIITTSALIALTLSAVKAQASEVQDTTDLLAAQQALATNHENEAPIFVEAVNQQVNGNLSSFNQTTHTRDYPNDNTADSLGSSITAIISESVDRALQGKSNTVGAWTLGFPSSAAAMLGNIWTSNNIFEDIARGIPSIRDQIIVQLPNLTTNPLINIPAQIITPFTAPIANAAIPVFNLLGKLFPISFKSWGIKPTFLPTKLLSQQIPTIQIIGNEFMADKSNPATITYSYYDPKTGETKNGYAASNWQGSSTQLLPKKITS